MAIRDHVVLLVNGQRHEVRDGDCFLTLAEYLRQRLRLVGTKVVCSEGDCGSCTVLVGRPVGDEIRYLPLDSCLTFLFQLDGTLVVTIEGLATAGQLTPVQEAMIRCHGSQCGFCTPGFVMAMTALGERPGDQPPDEETWRQGLTGNLCRCTGYTPILEAGRQAAQCGELTLESKYPPDQLAADLSSLADDTLDLRGESRGEMRHVLCPTTLAEAVRFRSSHPQAKVVAGATDVAVQWNKRTIGPTVWLDLNRVHELEGVRIETDPNGGRTLIAGARATWTDLHKTCQLAAPEFAEIISVFGSPQIRHAGTIGGNVMNASPIADSLPFLMVMEAELEMSSGRRVNVNRFYRGYKQFDLRADELLARVHLPLPADDELLRLYKVSRRRDLDIATFTAAIRMRLEDGTIAAAALAFGAVGPTVLRLRNTEAFLQGEPFTEETLRAAGEIAVGEIAPISDVRGSADYRRQLARNVLLKFYHQCQPVSSPLSAV